MLYFADNQHVINSLLFYQDFKDTFVCNTQLATQNPCEGCNCFIKISKILLYAIHNRRWWLWGSFRVVLSRFQRYFCMQYTTCQSDGLFLTGCFIRISKILLYAIHNPSSSPRWCCALFYHDFKDTFVCNTQPHRLALSMLRGCFIRISMNNLSAKVQKTYEICKFIWINFVISEKSTTFAATNLKDIHNKDYSVV